MLYLLGIVFCENHLSNTLYILLQLSATNILLDIQQVSFLQGQNECFTLRDALKFRCKDYYIEMPHNKL